MTSPKLTLLALMAFALTAMPVHLTAQEKAQEKCARHHRYKLIDLGSTFGGPQSYFSPGSGNDYGIFSSVLNKRGRVTGFANTPLPDPFPNFCFDLNGDCFVTHAFLANGSGGLTDLGALRPDVSSASTWISANGLIAGISENGEIDPLSGFPQMHAVLWLGGGIIDLGTLGGGYESYASAVNSSGQVVGQALNTIPDPNSMTAGSYWLGITGYQYQSRAFLWEEGKGMRDLGTLPGGTDAQAILINEGGQIIGWSYTGSAPNSFCPFPLVTGSFIWEKGKGMEDLGTLGGTCTTATDVNEHGQVVGASNLLGDQSVAAFLWEHGSIHNLGGTLGGDFTVAFAVNDHGAAVGSAYLPGDTTFHAAVWKHVGDITDLGTLGSDQCSNANAINAKEQIVGASISICNSDFANSRAFLWEHGSMFDLNTLIPSSSTVYLRSVETINDRGEIAGNGVDASDNSHAFLLIPCDENHPGVEGCDYSLVDAATAAEVRPARAARPSTATAENKASPAEMMVRIRSVRAGRNRKLENLPRP